MTTRHYRPPQVLAESRLYPCFYCGQPSSCGIHSLLWNSEAMAADEMWACWSCGASNPAELVRCCRKTVEQYVYDSTTGCTRR